MSEKRTFFVRVNLDDMAAEIIGLDSTDERGHWLEGFVIGSRGKDCREDWPAPKLEGHSFGLGCFNEAEAFRGKQSEKGLASAEARRNRSSAVVQPDANHGLTTVQPDANQTSTQPTTNNQQPTTRSQKPKKTHSSEVLSIYEAYPRHDGPGACSKQIIAALEVEPFESLLEATQAFCAAVRRWDKADQDQFTPMASTWFSQQRWMADRKTWERRSSAAPQEQERPSIQEWMQEGQAVATSNTTRNGATWPRDLCSAAYYQCASSSWRGITDWRGKLRAECLRWVGNENGRAR